MAVGERGYGLLATLDGASDGLRRAGAAVSNLSHRSSVLVSVWDRPRHSGTKRRYRSGSPRGGWPAAMPGRWARGRFAEDTTDTRAVRSGLVGSPVILRALPLAPTPARLRRVRRGLRVRAPVGVSHGGAPPGAAEPGPPRPHGVHGDRSRQPRGVPRRPRVGPGCCVAARLGGRSAGVGRLHSALRLRVRRVGAPTGAGSGRRADGARGGRRDRVPGDGTRGGRPPVPLRLPALRLRVAGIADARAVGVPSAAPRGPHVGGCRPRAQGLAGARRLAPACSGSCSPSVP